MSKTRSPSQMQFIHEVSRNATRQEIDAAMASLNEDFDRAAAALDVTTDPSETEYLRLYLRDVWKQRQDWADEIEYRRGMKNAIAGSKVRPLFI